MSTLLLAAMVACFVLLVAAVIAHRASTAAPETEHTAEDCRHCAALRHPSQLPARTALSTIPCSREGQ
ncbi:hypothetical protein AB0903_07985 [Streptomyces sp. NPDC048389]|uniref:hypothetical protein n=1 Tax=Streptomyces sp. NPDC048389 TaxID=3154622 RepID=UPI0034547E33